MPAPQCACCHKARAALRRPRSGQALCGICFCAAFEAEVLHTVVAGRLLPPGAVVAVGASGGKDSTVLAHVLRELAPRLGISLQLVAVDEGIGGYRDARSCCTFCGVLRWRRALEEGARLVGATHVVTGERMRVAAGFVEGRSACAGEGGTERLRGLVCAPRCKGAGFPSQRTQVSLLLPGSHITWADGDALRRPGFHCIEKPKMTKCRFRPSAVLDLMHSPPPAGACSRCGALASRALCQTCALLDGLDRGRPRLAICQGRRGRDEPEKPFPLSTPSRVPSSPL
uniref:Cytoplasmic tRNA 2-thiolation protein 1 C-terminal domain-containing protein n=1 Tax=Myotis lucifugus TaxID=59463 RepID=G1Q3G0_MYOLU